MAYRLSSRLTSLLLRHRTPPTTTVTNPLRHHFTTTSAAASTNPFLQQFHFLHPPTPPFSIRLLSTRSHRRSGKVDIAARARQLQMRRFWSYALAFSCVAGFVAIVLSQYKDYIVFYLSPSEILEKYTENPSQAKFRLGGLVLEGSVTELSSSSQTLFVVTDLLSDIMVRYEGGLPDLFREGHSVVAEGFIKPLTDQMKKEYSELGQKTLDVTEKARGLDCYFSASQVLAKHDEKYMPQEIAEKIENNKKILQEQEEEKKAAAAAAGTATA